MLAFNVHVDRPPIPALTGSPLGDAIHAARHPHAADGVGVPRRFRRPHRGDDWPRTGSVLGSVFADGNGDGVFDAGDQLLEGIPALMGAGKAMVTGRDGQFTFLNVPAGIRHVGLDTSALPIEFDPPEIARVELHLSRGDAHRVSLRSPRSAPFVVACIATSTATARSTRPMSRSTARS